MDAIGKHLASVGEFDHDEPALVWYKPAIVGEVSLPGWKSLSSHACNGFRLDYLSGWVLPVSIPKATEDLLYELVDEHFLAGCDFDSMDYEINPQHREAYSKWLTSHGLEEGDNAMFQQAVYPLAPTLSNVLKLGGCEQDIPVGAQLLVLGWNCD